MKKFFLEFFDKKLYDLLVNNVNIMPMRFVKMVAYGYSDARVRKLYLEKLSVYMGENTFSNVGLVHIYDFSDSSYVKIGNNVSIGPGLCLITAAVANNGKDINRICYVRDKITKTAPIRIEDDVWVGANVTILPGVRIGECSVIGAGSVVIADVPPNTIVAGIPARVIRHM